MWVFVSGLDSQLEHLSALFYVIPGAFNIRENGGPKVDIQDLFSELQGKQGQSMSRCL